MSSIKDYKPAPPGIRSSSKIQRSFGLPPPRRSALGLKPFTFWDGTSMPGGVHPLMVIPLQMMDAILKKHGYRVDASKDDWCWNRRQTRSGKSWSQHSWAIAIDLNAATNPYSRRFASDMPPAMVAEIESLKFNGVPIWAWGGQWGRGGRWKYDTMHWQLNLYKNEAEQLARQGGGGLTATSKQTPVVEPEEDPVMIAALEKRVAELEAQVNFMGLMAGIGTSTEDKVHAIYEAVFGVRADPPGLAFWVGEIDSGKRTVYQVAKEVQFIAEMKKKGA